MKLVQTPLNVLVKCNHELFLFLQGHDTMYSYTFSAEPLSLAHSREPCDIQTWAGVSMLHWTLCCLDKCHTVTAGGFDPSKCQWIIEKYRFKEDWCKTTLNPSFLVHLSKRCIYSIVSALASALELCEIGRCVMTLWKGTGSSRVWRVFHIHIGPSCNSCLFLRVSEDPPFPLPHSPSLSFLLCLLWYLSADLVMLHIIQP